MGGLRRRETYAEFWRDEDLGALPIVTRHVFKGLWAAADREGRMEDRPRRLRAEIFPYDHDLDMDEHIGALELARFLVRYVVDGQRYLQIRTSRKWFRPHPDERKSVIPPPQIVSDTDPTRIQLDPIRTPPEQVRVTPESTSVFSESSVFSDTSEQERGVDLGSPASQAKPAKQKAPRPRLTTIPEDWEPNETHCTIARNEGLKILEQELAFRQHAEMKARRLANWDLGFCVWLRKAKDFARPNGPPGKPTQTRSERILAAAEDVARRIEQAQEAQP